MSTIDLGCIREEGGDRIAGATVCDIGFVEGLISLYSVFLESTASPLDIAIRKASLTLDRVRSWANPRDGSRGEPSCNSRAGVGDIMWVDRVCLKVSRSRVNDEGISNMVAEEGASNKWDEIRGRSSKGINVEMLE